LVAVPSGEVSSLTILNSRRDLTFLTIDFSAAMAGNAMRVSNRSVRMSGDYRALPEMFSGFARRFFYFFAPCFAP
jgi:hypothetical protein